MLRRTLIFTLAGLWAVCFSMTARAAENLPPIPAGTTLHVRLGTTLTDATNKTGDPFNGIVTQPVVVKGKQVIAKYSVVKGHVAFVKPSGRIHGKAQMRIVIDSITTPDDVVYSLSASLSKGQTVGCGKKVSKADEEGTLTGCGKSKKDALKAAAIGGAVGVAGGASVGMAGRGGCDMYGNCWPSSGPGMGASIGYGAGIGAGTMLIYELFKHEKHIILIDGTQLTFVIDRTTQPRAPSSSSTQEASTQ